jgi:hypothetical protein
MFGFPLLLNICSADEEDYDEEQPNSVQYSQQLAELLLNHGIV